MFIQLQCGMNIPNKYGETSPVNAGDVVDVPDKFARQQIAGGRAIEVTAGESENRETELKAKMQKR